jgi:hypothetical protein
MMESASAAICAARSAASVYFRLLALPAVAALFGAIAFVKPATAIP